MLEDLDAELGGGAGELLGELRGMDQGDVVVQQSGEVRRAVHQCADLVGVEEGAGGLAQPGHLVRLGRDVELAGPLVLAVEPEVTHGPLDAVEVLPAHPLEHVVLVGPAGPSVLLPVRDARGTEPAVATRRRPADGAPLEQHHPGARVALLGEHGRPQAAVATADDDEVGVDRARQRRVRRSARDVLQPVAGVAHRRERGVHDSGGRRVAGEDGAGHDVRSCPVEG